MKLLRLYVESYRVLQDLEIQFQPGYFPSDDVVSYGLDFLVGLNGSGKSTVLEAIVDIFLRLERHSSMPFVFELSYEIGEGNDKRIIFVTNRATENAGMQPSHTPKISVNGEDSELSTELFPSAIVVFTSGSEVQWLDIEKPEDGDTSDVSYLKDISLTDRSIKELPGRTIEISRREQRLDSEKSRFWLIQNTHIPSITICGLLEFMAQQDGSQYRGLGEVLKHCAVRRVWGFSLKFRMNEGIISAEEREEILRLRTLASRALNLGSDKLLVFDFTHSAESKARTILEQFGGGFRLFQNLARMQANPDSAENVLQEVSIFLERISQEEHESEQPLHLFDWLSDGEQSFIGRMCLFNLLNQQEALILLDEPEVHFNDYWKRQIVNMIDGILQGQSSHVLISTHSSITLTDVPSNDIIVLERPGPYTTSSKTPRVPTLAADPSDIMVHVFGTRHAAGQRAVEQLLGVLGADLPVGQRKRQLEELQKLVGPGYWSYRIRRALATLGAS